MDDRKIIEIKKILAGAPAKKSTNKPSVEVKASGNGVAAGRDVNITNINTKKVVRPKIVRGPDKISSSQAAKLQDLVKKLVEREIAGGVLAGDEKRLYAKWWNVLKKHYGVNSYLEIPSQLGEDAIVWLSQHSAIKRSKLRRTDKATWRNEHYSAIYARTKELGISKGDLYSMVYERTGKRIVSLTALNEKDLKNIYSFVMSKKRGDKA